MSDRSAATADTQRFRPSARRRNRLAAGVALGAAAIGGNVLVYSALGSTDPVVQVTRDVPAGEVITADMLRVVDVDVDDSVNVISGDDLDALVGSYAKVRLVAGSLVVPTALQPEPLVTPGSAVVAIEVKASELPVGVRERVPVRLVMSGVTPPGTNDPVAPVTVDGRVVGLPAPSESSIGATSVSVEVPEADAATVAAADSVDVVLLVPSVDAAAVGDAPAGDVDGTSEGGS